MQNRLKFHNLGLSMATSKIGSLEKNIQERTIPMSFNYIPKMDGDVRAAVTTALGGPGNESMALPHPWILTLCNDSRNLRS